MKNPNYFKKDVRELLVSNLEVKVEGELLKKTYIGTEIVEADSLVESVQVNPTFPLSE